MADEDGFYRCKFQLRLLLRRNDALFCVQVLLRRFRNPAQKVLLFSYSTATLDLLQVRALSRRSCSSGATMSKPAPKRLNHERRKCPVYMLVLLQRKQGDK